MGLLRRKPEWTADGVIYIFKEENSNEQVEKDTGFDGCSDYD